ncbi:MAG: thiamine diphosphokinase [Caldithrix sp.]|nr:thiamine diphosphokinase [Caldithrix sp.]
MQKNGAIIANGQPIQTDRLTKILKDVSIIIAADAGALHCRQAGISPHYIIGDLDSIAGDLKAGFPHAQIIHQPSQYATDMEKALQLAVSLKLSKIKVLSALGRRSDHAVANLLFFREFRDDITLDIYDRYGKFTLLKPGRHLITAQTGQTISLIAMQSVNALTLSGFRYPLDRENFDDFFVGISNVAESDDCIIEFSSGKLFLYQLEED